MTSPLVRSISAQLRDLEKRIREEQPSSGETPEGNFARHVFEAVAEEGPVADWGAEVESAPLRKGMAPALSAFGYRITRRHHAPEAGLNAAWETGLRRLAQRETFTTDRQTFAFRPVEMYGLALGVLRSTDLPSDLRDWLRDVFEKVVANYPHDDWALPFYAIGAHLLGAPILTLRRAASPIEQPMYALALTMWASQVYPVVPIGPVASDADQEFLRRVLLEDLQVTDLAKSSILYQAIRRAVTKRLESDLSETWQLDRRTRDAVTLVVNLCRRFHQLALQLQVRHSGRPTLSFNDEYDVQDALHAILRVHFDDVRAEEWTPSYAGSANRMDFLLKREKVVVEAKMTRKSLKQKDVSEQLIQDKERYRAHADCRELVCFVYDPGNYLSNPTALEDDLSTSDESLRTTVVVSPRN